MQDVLQQSPKLIEKEIIPTLLFQKPILLEQQEGLMEKLMEATKLGNIHHGKIAIIFQDDEGLKRVETTIWATGLKYICLKGGVWLPISRIKEIQMV
ncbi:MAG: hypothetical protein COA32_15065 [Fluviicola sp.]|nr:MAG: hypothetical protein COA32_15065 [Fluviicola sp.]